MTFRLGDGGLNGDGTEAVSRVISLEEVITLHPLVEGLYQLNLQMRREALEALRLKSTYLMDGDGI